MAVGAFGLRHFKGTLPAGGQGNLLGNPGFEVGLAQWTAPEGSVTASEAAATAHAGSGYAEAFLAPGHRSATLWAADQPGKTLYLQVDPGDVVTFGAWVYRVSGDERVGCKLRASDAGKGIDSWIAPVPDDAAPGEWTLQQGTFKVPAGKRFVSFFLEILASDDTAARTMTMARFDDAFLQVKTGRQPGPAGVRTGSR